MKKAIHLPLAVLVLILVGIGFYVALGRASVQAQRSASESLITRTAESAPAKRESSASSSAFAGAAARNAQLRRSLSWTFGGKSQTGWEIYVPLITHAIDVDAKADSPEFAAALSKWQAKNELQPTGVLETDTLQALIRFWQGQRLGRSTAPADGSLLSAPIIEFFDQSRDPGLLQLERETYAAYKRMIAAAAKDLGTSVRFSKTGELAGGEKFLRIVSAYRSPAYQEELRRKQPNAGRGALAKFSAHSTGQALDIYVGGEPVSTKDHNRLLQVQTPAYKWLVKNANRFGFYNYFYEPWHWEYVPGR
jgi:D-alanyl-D-alanine carboxypeptidase